MEKRRIKPNSYDTFHDLLRINGFDSYEDYIHSEHWKAFNQWYRQCKFLIQRCVVCESRTFELHHWTYIRVTQENLQDVIPLCRQHHQELHTWIEKHKIPLYGVRRQFRDCFGLKQQQLTKLLSQIKKGKRKDKWIEIRPHGNQKRKLNKAKIETAKCGTCGKTRNILTLRDNGKSCKICKRREAKKNWKSTPPPFRR